LDISSPVDLEEVVITAAAVVVAVVVAAARGNIVGFYGGFKCKNKENKAPLSLINYEENN